jgi:hypothetical protein
MNVEVRVDRQHTWSWHVVLIAALVADGVRVRVVSVETRGRRPAWMRAILAMEAPHEALRPVPFEALAAAADAGSADRDSDIGTAEPELVLDLSAEEIPERGDGVRTLVPLFDGRPGEERLWAAVLAQRAPRLSLADSTRDRPIAIGQPAIDVPHAVKRSLGQVLVRLIEGIVINVTAAAPVAITPVAECGGGYRVRAEIPALSVLPSMVTRKLAAKAASMAAALRPDLQDKWAVAWRRHPGRAPAFSDRPLSLADYNVLPDDGRRYYADPFLIARDGAIHCFVEEFPYATRRGIISHTLLRDDGTAATPRPVLETGHHLSYPQVFVDRGEVYMLPEQHEAGGLILYRAARFPDQWEPVARLIDEPVHDATLFQASGRWWIRATMAGPAGMRWGTSWDSAYLWSADDLLSTWTRAGRGPVRIDAARSRPAGPLLRDGGMTYRPVQDCSAGYGCAVEIEEFDDANPAAPGRRVARLSFTPGTGLSGPHALSRIPSGAATFEAIDVFASGYDIAVAHRAPRRPPLQQAIALAMAAARAV